MYAASTSNGRRSFYLREKFSGTSPTRFQEMGRKGARVFWDRFHNDEVFRSEMIEKWRHQKFDPAQKTISARLGAQALWKRYRTDEEFRTSLDQKLKASRSRGGAISLRNLGEVGFKVRLEKHGFKQVKPKYVDRLGNRLRSKLEVGIANELIDGGLQFTVEPGVQIGDHAFYPDFGLAENSKFIEVVGYMGDEYWDRTARKIGLLIGSLPDVKVAVVTSFFEVMKKRLRGIDRTVCFRPYQVDELLQWCRGSAGVHRTPEGRVVYCAGLESP